MADEVLAQTLAKGVTTLGLSLSPERQQLLLDYLALLHRWNRAYNLSGIQALPEMLSKHLLDCLAIVPFVPRGRILDIGTGAGLPGMVLAIALPECQLDLLDSKHKKTLFLEHAVAELGLTNVRVICRRIEDYQSDGQYVAIVCRAVATLAEMLHKVRHLWSNNTKMLAMKGRYPAAEIAELGAEWRVECEPLTIPGDIGERHLIIADRPMNERSVPSD
jgi:16S rRNA (guanine527-N7)-methyltransferase